jgi:hypothetical protein
VACRACAQEAEPKEEYILIVDADNIMRFPFDPVQLRVEPGARTQELMPLPFLAFQWPGFPVLFWAARRVSFALLYLRKRERGPSRGSRVMLRHWLAI